MDTWVVTLRQRASKRNVLSRNFNGLTRVVFSEFAAELHRAYKTHTPWASSLDLVLRRGEENLATILSLNHLWRWEVASRAETLYDLVS
uniref:Uncharacterized protein n=1 Tax=Marseillevirus LCMAC103 TaxID=2506604 RepID=A0A481YV70_9VIRU|nr:MAG: hypothetical protein LCMAC103_01330 [Marseillevirus LCMAC103]